MLFAHIQYPIIDFRHFLNDEIKREQPVFPSPSTNTWLRNFGHVRERRTDTCPYYIAENFFCEAHNAVRFEKLPLFIGKEQYESFNGECDWIDYPLYNKICKFRRFRSDGNLKSCFEVGMLTNPVCVDDVIFTHQELKKINVNVKSYTRKKMIRVPLFDLGSHLCKLYEDSTCIKKSPVKTIYSGNPFVVYIDQERYSCFNDDNFISHKEFYKMGFDVMHYKDHKNNFWLIDPRKYHYDKKLLASIRRALLAISLEKEALIAAYNFLLLHFGKGYVNETKVFSYIKNTQEKLLKRIRFDIPQSSIVDIIFKMDFEDNKAFYLDIINLISKVGDKYIANDFNKLFIQIEFNNWREKILGLLETTNDKDIRGKLEQLRDICIEEDKGRFWFFINKYKIPYAVNVTSNMLYECLKTVFSGLNNIQVDL